MRPGGGVCKQKVNLAMSTEKEIKFGHANKGKISLPATGTDTGHPHYNQRNTCSLVKL